MFIIIDMSTVYILHLYFLDLFGTFFNQLQPTATQILADQM